MENSVEFLQKAISSIKLMGVTHGQVIAEDDIAQKAGISLEQLQAFLTGKEKIPYGLDVKLLGLYGMKRRTITIIDKISFDDEDDEDNDEEDEDGDNDEERKNE